MEQDSSYKPTTHGIWKAVEIRARFKGEWITVVSACWEAERDAGVFKLGAGR
jgi:hypothetical protein